MTFFYLTRTGVSRMSLTFLGILVPCLFAQTPVTGSYVCQPAYARDWELRGPVEPYVPQAGDIFLATDQRLWFRWGHLIAGANGVHHSGIIVALPDGELRLIEAGPFDKVQVEMMNPYQHMSQHAAAGRPGLGASAQGSTQPRAVRRLTAFACAQDGKPFALARWFGQLTPLRPRSNQDLVRRRAARRQGFVVLLRAGRRVLRGSRNHGPGNRQAVGDLPQRPLLGPLLQSLPQRPPRPGAGLVPAGPMAARAASASHE